MTSTYVKNYGMIENYVKNNDKITTTGAKWIGDYDGSVANVDIDISNNGSVEHTHLRLNNDDLLDILNMDTIDRSIDQRLSSDFLLDAPSPHIPVPPRIPFRSKRHALYPRKFNKPTSRIRGVKKSKKRHKKAKKKTRKIDPLIQLSSL
uniref:Uncharacterized protein n=1 Tax=viral metagenome TaxID=1070528 RepID=A0A6C0E0Q6_9ZZZZ